MIEEVATENAFCQWALYAAIGKYTKRLSLPSLGLLDSQTGFYPAHPGHPCRKTESINMDRQDIQDENS